MYHDLLFEVFDYYRKKNNGLDNVHMHGNVSKMSFPILSA